MKQKKNNAGNKYKELLKIARSAIESKFHNKEIYVNEDIKKKFSEKKACFVTLTKNRELRGCIGSLQPRQELWKDVVDNAIHSAFNDYRFIPVNENELKKIKIEISVLTTQKKLRFKNESDLLRKINKNRGIILQKNGSQSTFLPQVWEQIKDKKEFLEQLSLKAGLNKDDWKNSDFWFYNVEKVEED